MSEKKENTRHASVFDDEERRRKSVAGLTNNVGGEYVVSADPTHSETQLTYHQNPQSACWYPARGTVRRRRALCDRKRLD